MCILNASHCTMPGEAECFDAITVIVISTTAPFLKWYEYKLQLVIITKIRKGLPPTTNQ